jgi:hypothetical protein
MPEPRRRGTVLLARVDAPSSGRCLNPVPPLNPCLIRQVSTQLRGPTQRSAEVTGTVRGRSQSQVLQAQIAFNQQTLWVDGLIIRSGPVVDPVRAAREALGRGQLASPERPAHGRRCRCGWPPAARRSRPPATPKPTVRAGHRRTRGPAGTAPEPLDPPARGLLRPAGCPGQLGR